MAQVKDQPSATQQPANDPGQQSQQRGLSRRREDFLPSLWAESPFAFMRRFSEEMDRFFGGTLPVKDIATVSGVMAASPAAFRCPRALTPRT
jgi:hypothetical protein